MGLEVPEVVDGLVGLKNLLLIYSIEVAAEIVAKVNLGAKIEEVGD